MKRILIVLGIIAVFSLGVEAQDATVRSGGTNFNVALTAVDTISTYTTTLSKTIGIGAKTAIQLYSFEVSLDSVSGTPTEAWVLAGSMDNSTFYNIDTVSWTGTSSDTTFIFTDISTGVAWPYMRVMGTESGTAKAKLTEVRGRFIDKVK